MEKRENLTENKQPTIIIDSALNEYRDKVMFPEKLKQAKEVFKTAKLPQNKNRH